MTSIIQHITAVSNKFYEENNFVLPKCHLITYLKQLEPENYDQFLICHQLPQFEEEIIVNYQTIYQKHCATLPKISEDEQLADYLFTLNDWLKTIPFKEILIIIGQRLTPASITTSKALPPNRELLFENAFVAYNKEIKIAVRAWEKHVGRTQQNFWGAITGTPAQRELHVRELIKTIQIDATWWNVFEHFKHGTIYEIREINGHGIRWQLDSLEFIGFVEPFDSLE